MKLLFFFVFSTLFLLYGTASNKDKLLVSKRLPKRLLSILETEKEQIINGVKGAIQYFNFLSEKNFFSTLTKISSVAEPIFSTVSGILTVAFILPDKESPEMLIMKREFSQLNNHFDRWNTEFKDIKRKIDWSEVQINFGEIENSILSLHKLIAEITNTSNVSLQKHLEIFLNNYEMKYKAAGYILYSSMINIEQIYSINLFRTAQHFMENDRGQVQQFMMDLMTLLTQSIQLEAFYVKLKYNDQKASDFTQSLWAKKLAILKEKIEQVDLDTKEKYEDQYAVDLDNLLVQHRSLTNEKFLDIAIKFYNKKYDWRIWFILVYNKVSGFNNHAVTFCQGTYRFRTHGRNVIISSIDKSSEEESMAHMDRNNEVISSPLIDTKKKDLPLAYIDHFRNKLPSCEEANTIAAVAWGSGVWYSTSNVLVYKKNCISTKKCYNTFIFG